MTFMQLLKALHEQHRTGSSTNRQIVTPSSALFLSVDIERPVAANDDKPFLSDLHHSIG